MFTAGRKLDMASLLKQAFEDRRIRIPAGDAKLRADLHAIRKTTGASGAPRLIDDGTSDGHADRFWAYAMAVAAAQTAPFDVAYEGIRGRHNEITVAL